MGKRLKKVTLERQERWFKEHRKSIESGRYIPFWRVEDIKSRGIKVKIRHFSDPDRVIHLLSINELHMYVLLAWDPEIIEVYEQYAIPIEDSIKIAKEEKIEHPVYSDSRTPTVQTIDFMCVKKNNSNFAYIVKESSELDSERIQDKLDIQREYLKQNCIPYEEIYSDELKQVKYQNLVRLFDHSNLPYLLMEVHTAWLSNFIGVLSGNRYERIQATLEESANITGIPYQMAASFLYFSFWKCDLLFDMNCPLLLERCAMELGVYPNERI